MDYKKWIKRLSKKVGLYMILFFVLFRDMMEWHSTMRGRGIGAYFGKPVSTSFCCSLMVEPVGRGVAWCYAEGRSIAHLLVSPLRW